MMLFRLIKPLLKWNALNFLKTENIQAKSETLIKKKLGKLGSCNIGRSLGAGSGAKIDDLPITGYDHYLPYFKNPKEGDFMHPLKDYVKTYTSGTMGKPKVYLMPQTAFKNNLKNAGLSLIFVVTHDGENSTVEVGDTIFTNMPGGSFVAGFMGDSFKRDNSSFLHMVPPDANSMGFKDKVDYFINNHQKIDIAYMTVTSFLDEIVPKVKEPIQLKGFMTQDIAAGPLKEDIRAVSGTYPSTVYASTEGMLMGLPSVQYPGAFFLDWRVVYPEFIKKDEALNVDIGAIYEHPDVIKMSDLKIGERYQLIISPLFNDMTRYVTPDILECIATGDDNLGVEIPIFKYYSRADNILVLHNFTRISEEELVSVLKISGVPFVDFAVQKTLEDAREYLHLYIELKEEMPYDELQSKVNEALREFDKDWRDLTNFLNYTPLRITVLAKATFANFLHNKPGMARVVRIGMRPERFQELLSYS